MLDSEKFAMPGPIRLGVRIIVVSCYEMTGSIRSAAKQAGVARNTARKIIKDYRLKQKILEEKMRLISER